MWTLENGHCVNSGSIFKNLSDIDELEACVLYLKCKLTNDIITGCDDVIRLFDSLCWYRTIQYPSGPILKPYLRTTYHLRELESSLLPHYIFFNGSARCPGYQAHSNLEFKDFPWIQLFLNIDLDGHLCNNYEELDVFGPQISKNCWNDTKQSFLCQRDSRCISKYRLRDSNIDCSDGRDEDGDQSDYIKKEHRLYCKKFQSGYILLSQIGDGSVYCDGAKDEYITQFKWNLFNHQCRIANSMECNILRTYIKSPSSLLIIDNRKVILFRQYCDTLWDLPRGFDESMCKEWKCLTDRYQCLTGHCISPLSVLNKYSQFDRQIDNQWDCPDASDDIRLLEISQLPEHNLQLISHSDLIWIKDLLINYNTDHRKVPFSSYCNVTKEYGCVLANVTDPLDFAMNRPCINLTQIGDSIIDCYGGLDERNLLTCGDNLYEQRGFDFHCSDQECIPYYRLCEQRCSNKADSLLCDQSLTPLSLRCQQEIHWRICADPYMCEKLREIKRYYCDASRQYYVKPYRFEVWGAQNTWIYLPEYPSSKVSIHSIYVQPSQRVIIDNYLDVPNKAENNGEEGWICGRGVAIKRNKDNQVQCFCPPSLYGEYCQYFSDRIIVITSLDNIPSELLEQKSNIIKILALFLSNDTIIDYHIFHLVLSKELNKKFRFYFIYQRPKLLLTSYSIRFEAYSLSLNSSIQFLNVWEYLIQFPFLPSYRLVQILNFEKQRISMNETHICQQSDPCLHNSTCYPIMNKFNDTSSYFCHCMNNSFGKRCEHLMELNCVPVCSKDSLFRPLSSLKSLCLCPIYSYGPTCHLNHTCVNKNPCGLNRGECYVNPDNFTRDYICVCDKKFFGDHCELDSAMVQINFIDLSFIQMPSNFILSTIIELYDLQNETLDLILQQKRVYQGFPPLMTEIYHNNHHLPRIGIIKFYHKQDLSNDHVANLKHPAYFLLYISSSNVSSLNLTSVMNITNYCSYAPLRFEKNVSNISYLSQLLFSNEMNMNNSLNVSTIVFRYHLLCDEPYSLMCFHDENYFCLCDIYNHAECFSYNSTLDQCNIQCNVNGQCIHGDLDNRKDFICLCPRCYYGSICQHNTELFSFTLESLLANDLNSASIATQRLFSSLLIIIPIILFLIGIINNICCFLTFNRIKPLLVGAGHYLRTVSIINQLVLLILTLKLIHIVLSIRGYIVDEMVNIVLCKIFSYLLSCTSRMSYWIMAMITIERVYVTWHLRGVWLKSPRIAKRILGITIISIIASNIHELIYYQSIEDPKSINVNNSALCITSYSYGVGIYNQINNILNYTLPFFINFLSTIILIVMTVRKRMAASKKQNDHSTGDEQMKSTFRTYWDLLVSHKELILAPLMTMLPQFFSLPQFILSFSLACKEFKINWQRYLLITSYFLTYLPQVFLYRLYISPSTFYKNEFHNTKLYKNIKAFNTFRFRQESETTLSHTTT